MLMNLFTLLSFDDVMNGSTRVIYSESQVANELFHIGSSFNILTDAEGKLFKNYPETWSWLFMHT